MPTSDVSFPTPDGTCTAVLAVPDGDGPWPAVVMIPDIGSVRPAFRAMAQRLAAEGLVVLVPDIYHRAAPYRPFDASTMFVEPEEFPRARSMAEALTPDAVASDAQGWLDFLATRPEVRPGPIGTTGYCFGGKLSLTVAGRLGEAIGAAASFHGGGLGADDPSSPHLLADGVRAAVYIGAALDDRSFPQEQEDRLRAAYDAAGVTYELETYAAAHGFAVTDFPVYDEAAAERHWAAMADLYRSRLGA
ncbi:MAG: dienelactone hydrolase family protein [Acidimicrobiales bacterium]